MPIYEYECQECGKVSEVLHKSLNIKPVSCPVCHSQNVSKLHSVPMTITTKRTIPSDISIPCGKRGTCQMPASDCPAARLEKSR
jgi:putative FmdB family regulatory protein